jgi:hypothetical protein
MMTRILDASEWDRLGQSGLLTLLPYVDPRDARVVVVEENGEILASLAVLRMAHFEGLWIEPSHRGNAGVGRALIRAAFHVAHEWGDWAIGCAATGTMQDVMVRLGGAKIPVDTYALHLGGERTCPLL